MSEERGGGMVFKLRARWNAKLCSSSKLKFYSGSRWKWRLLWRWLGYRYAPPFEVNETAMVQDMAEQIREEIDNEILAELFRCSYCGKTGGNNCGKCRCSAEPRKGTTCGS